MNDYSRPKNSDIYVPRKFVLSTAVQPDFCKWSKSSKAQLCQLKGVASAPRARIINWEILEVKCFRGFAQNFNYAKSYYQL